MSANLRMRREAAFTKRGDFTPCAKLAWIFRRVVTIGFGFGVMIASRARFGVVRGRDGCLSWPQQVVELDRLTAVAAPRRAFACICAEQPTLKRAEPW